MKDENGETALMVAVESGQLSCVEEMAKMDGVDWETKNKEGESLEDVARKMKHAAVLEFLEQRKYEAVAEVATVARVVGVPANALEALEALELKQSEEKEELNTSLEKEKQDFYKKQTQEKEDFEKNQSQEKHDLEEKQNSGKSQIHQEFKIKMSKLEKKLQALVTSPVAAHPTAPECPVCMESMVPPIQIFNCPNGHLSCGVCKDKLPNCTICNQAIMGRATAMEQILRTLYNTE